MIKLLGLFKKDLGRLCATALLQGAVSLIPMSPFISSVAFADHWPSAAVDGPQNSTGAPHAASGASWDRSGSSAAPTSVSTTVLKKRDLDPLSSTEQARLYQRANENITTQTVYIQKNLDSVKSLYDDLDDGNYTSPNINTTTSQYCDGSSFNDVTEAKRCLDQYREIKFAELRDLQQGLVTNNETQAKLREGGSKSSNRPPVYGAEMKQKVYPKIPTYMELGKDFAINQKQSQQSPLEKAEQAKALAERIMKNPPDPKDFWKLQKAPIDPDNPKAGTYMKIVRGSDGKPLLDSKAYAEAKAIYDRMVQLRGTGSNSTDEIVNRIQKAQLAQQQRVQGNLSLDAVTGDGNRKGPQSCADLKKGTRRDYCEARNIVVAYFNGEPEKLNARKTDSLRNSDGGREPSSPTASAKGIHTEDYELKAGTPQKNKDGKEENANLYMEPDYIDGVIKSQLPNP